MEEVSLRATVALGQKRAIHTISNGDEVSDAFEREHRRLSAAVVGQEVVCFGRELPLTLS